MVDSAARVASCIDTCDVHEAQARGGEVYFPHQLHPRHRSDQFRMHLEAAAMGPLSIGVLGYSDEVFIETSDYETSYEVNIPLSGFLETWTGQHWVVASPDTAAIYRPVGNTSLRGWAGGGDLIGLKIDRTALEGTMAELIGEPIEGAIPLASSLDLTRSFGRHWGSLVRTVLDMVTDAPALNRTPQVANPLIEAVLTGLLFAADHPYQDRLGRPVPARPATLQGAIDVIEAEPAEAWTLAELAQRAGCSTRSLQDGFQRHVGVSPMTYLRDVRLNRAHADLVAADPEFTSVAAIAGRWGCAHLGRFAAAYRARHGTTPSDTLRTHRRLA